MPQHYQEEYLNVGDKVILWSTGYGDEKVNPLWNGSQGQVTGRVFEIEDDGGIRVEWKNGETNWYKSYRDLRKISCASADSSCKEKTKDPLNVGDRVALVSKTYDDSPSNPIWGGDEGKILGTIIEKTGNLCTVKWDNGRTNWYNLSTGDLKVVRWTTSYSEEKEEDRLEDALDKIIINNILDKIIINNIKHMENLTPIQQATMDEDAKKLYKAGFLYSDMNLSDRGNQALVALLFAEKKAELVKLAEERIAESENK